MVYYRRSECKILSFVMQEDENLTREQIEDEIKKIKAAHAEDEGTSLFLDMFPLSSFTLSCLYSI